MSFTRVTGCRNQKPRRLEVTKIILGVFVLVTLWSGPSAPAQMIDLNSNGMSDVWEWVYNATNVPPNLDSDGDGVSNFNESQAGTSPFNPDSVPKISLFSFT